MSDLRDIVESLVHRVIKNHKYYGHYRYRVREDRGPTTQTSRPDLEPVRQDIGLPVLPATDKTFGAPGIFAKMKSGTDVLVGFEGGNSSFPYVAAFLPTAATDVEFVVSGVVKVIGEIPSGTVQPVALYQAFRTYVDTVEVYLLACDTLLSGLVGAPLTPLITARKAAANLLDNASSTKLEAE